MCLVRMLQYYLPIERLLQLRPFLSCVDREEIWPWTCPFSYNNIFLNCYSTSSLNERLDASIDVVSFHGRYELISHLRNDVGVQLSQSPGITDEVLNLCSVIWALQNKKVEITEL